MLGFPARTNVTTNYDIVVLTGFPKRVPIFIVNRRITKASGIVRKRQRMHTLLGKPFHFCYCSLHIPKWNQHQGNKTPRGRIAPVIQMPVVVCLDSSQRDFAVWMILKTLAGKSRKGREAKRSNDTRSEEHT